MLLLDPWIRDYTWGRTDGISALVGSAPTGGPEAELWVGAHPGGAAVVEGDGRTLAEIIAEDPVRHLGAELVAEGITELPFLLKVLAIGRPLSLQAHPSADQAAAGFAREESAGIAIDSPKRTYRDPNPKPEALVALAPTWALCGFRNPEDTRSLVSSLGLAAAQPLLGALDAEDTSASALRWLLGEEARGCGLIDELAAAIPPDADARIDATDPSSEDNARAWIARLQAAFPGDPTALAPLLVEVVHLEAGDAVHLPAGNLHAYLEGAGVEIMAASDNVLRGGLTEKHIDVDELIEILRFEPGVPEPPRRTRLDRITVYDPSERAFALAVVEPGADMVPISPRRPSLLLASGGPVEVTSADGTVAVLGGGRSAFLSAGSPPVEVRGAGRLWWATTGDGLPF